jgi:hypothetical protein
VWKGWWLVVVQVLMLVMLGESVTVTVDGIESEIELVSSLLLMSGELLLQSLTRFRLRCQMSRLGD